MSENIFSLPFLLFFFFHHIIDSLYSARSKILCNSGKAQPLSAFH